MFLVDKLIADHESQGRLDLLDLWKVREQGSG
jgi:hypothetical protein